MHAARDDEVAPRTTAEQWYVDAFSAHGAAMFHYLRYLGADWHTAQDVLADAMLRVWNRIQEAPPPEEAAAYLKRTVRNAYVDHRRRARVREVAIETLPGEVEKRWLQDAVDHWLGVEDVRRALDRLRAGDRRLIVLATQGLSLADLADALDLPSANAAGAALHRARAALRRELQRSQGLT